MLSGRSWSGRSGQEKTPGGREAAGGSVFPEDYFFSIMYFSRSMQRFE
jgi:hypothetical protein